MSILRRLLPSPRTLRGKLGIAAFLTTFLVLVGSTASYAYWQASVSATSTLGAANLTLATSNFTSVAYTFGNESLVTTGSVTVTNNTATTSTQAGAVALTFGPTASATLAGKVSLSIWTTTNASNCTAAATVPGTATTAFWSANTVISSSLTPGASTIYCLRSSIANREAVATASGSLSFTPQISGTITLGNFSGTAVATVTQATQYIFPSYSVDTSHWNFIRPNFDNQSYDYCLDVSGGGASTTGTMVISFGCKTSGVANQQWKFTASGVAGYYTIQPRNATTLRVDNNSSTATGAGINVITAGTAVSAKNQQWQLQLNANGAVQFVNALSGLCLTSPSGASQNLGQITQTACNGTQYQQFLLSQSLDNLTCTGTTTAWTFSWTSTTTGQYHVQVQGTTTDIAVTASATAASVSVPTTGYAKNTTTNVNIIDGNGTLVATGALVRNNGNTYTCSGYDLQ